MPPSPAPISVLIPCARRVGSDLEHEFGPIPPGLMPIAGQAALDRIVAGYGDLDGLRVYVAVYEGEEMVRRHYEFFPDPRVTLVPVGPTVGIGETLATALEKHPEIADGYLVVNFADTIVEARPPLPLENDFVGTAPAEESIRWTLFQEEDGRIVCVSDKEFQLEPEAWRMFVGLWGVREPRRFLQALNAKEADRRPAAFYEAVVEYYNSSPTTRFLDCPDYIDVGHADNYFAARRRLINRRFFNSLEFNETSGSIRKASENREKLVDEIGWYQSLPPELAFYTPRLFAYSKDPLAPFVEMEFYSYPSLDDGFVSGRYDLDVWEKFFAKIFDVLRVAGKYTVADPDLGRDLEEMYVAKTVGRLRPFLDAGGAPEELAERGAVVNGLRCPSLRQALDELPGRLERAGALDAATFGIVHGDLCLGNILYDASHGLLKLIDARGRFGRYTIYGDVYYDLAKLSHSVLGHYDFIMADQFRVERPAPGEFALRTRAGDYHDCVGAIFRKHLRKNGFDEGRVRLLEALLFLSMVPLHRDREDRQLAMLLRGVSILGELGA